MGVLTVPLLFTSLLLSALTGGPSTAPLPGESVRERVEVIVREAVEEPASDLRALEYLLIDLGPDAIEPLFELLKANFGTARPLAGEPPRDFRGDQRDLRRERGNVGADSHQF